MTTALVFSTPAEAAAAVGRQVGPSEWLTVETRRSALRARDQRPCGPVGLGRTGHSAKIYGYLTSR